MENNSFNFCLLLSQCVNHSRMKSNMWNKDEYIYIYIRENDISNVLHCYIPRV